MCFKINKTLRATLLIGSLLLFPAGLLHAQAEQACLIDGVTGSGEKINDCIINNGIREQTALAKFCYEFTELRSTYQRIPEPRIAYMAVCPLEEQASCVAPANTDVHVLYYARTPAQLALEQEYCDLLEGEWSDVNQAEKIPIATVDERYNLCKYVQGKSFVSLQRFTRPGLSLITYRWKLEFNDGKLIWRKNADETEMLSYSCKGGEISTRSLATDERYSLEASIYSRSVIFDGIAYEQLSR